MSGKPLSAIAAWRAKQAAQPIIEPKTTASVPTAGLQDPNVAVESSAQTPYEKPKTRSSTKRAKKRQKLSDASDDVAAASKTNGNVAIKSKTKSETPKKRPAHNVPLRKNDNRGEAVSIASNTPEESDDSSSILESDQAPLNQPAVQLSEVGDRSRIQYGTDNSVQVVLLDKEFVTIVGEYDLWVRKGSVSVFGAMLHASSKIHHISAPASHSLPCIAHARSPFGPEKQQAELTITSTRSCLPNLGRLNPTFAKIWSSESGNRSRSFQILHSSKEDKLERPLSRFRPSVDWQTLAVTICGRDSDILPSIMVCGPKGAGKSSYGRYLANAMLSRKLSDAGIAILDIDPGQPEYSTPGSLSLCHVRSFNLAPPFAHPKANGMNEILRSHYIGETSPIEDPIHYEECVIDLYEHYRRTLGKVGCPLLINSCGWIQGCGLEILEAIINRCELTDVIYMSTLGPFEAIEALRTATTETNTKLHLLTSQPTTISLRSAADQRLMQTMSYFHLDTEVASSSDYWDQEPLSKRTSRIFKYAGPNQDIAGIMIYGDEYCPEGLKGKINGSICALVAIDDRSALPPSVYKVLEHGLHEDEDKIMDNSTDDPLIRESSISSQNTSSSSPINYVDSNIDSSFFTALTNHEMSTIGFSFPTKRPRKRPAPLCRDPNTGLPYIFIGSGSDTSTLLDPTKTRLIAQILVRDIDEHSSAIKYISPLLDETLEQLRKKGIPLVLIKGSADVSKPRWSYMEEFYEGTSRNRDRTVRKKFAKDGKEKTAKELDSNKGRRGGKEKKIETEDLEQLGEDSEGSFDIEAFVERSPFVSTIAKNAGKIKKVSGKKWTTRRNMVTDDGRRGG